MALTKKQNLLLQVRQIAKALFLIDPKKLATLLENAGYFSEEGLLETLDFLNDAIKKQTELLRKFAEKDPHLNEDLKKFLRQEYQSHTNTIGLAEKDVAENILSKF